MKCASCPLCGKDPHISKSEMYREMLRIVGHPETKYIENLLRWEVIAIYNWMKAKAEQAPEVAGVEKKK